MRQLPPNFELPEMPPLPLGFRLTSFALRSFFQFLLWTGQPELAKNLLLDHIASTVDTTVACLRKVEHEELASQFFAPESLERLLAAVRRHVIDEGHVFLDLLSPPALRDWAIAEYDRKVAWRLPDVKPETLTRTPHANGAS